MAYATTAEVKAFLKITTSTDDALIANLITVNTAVLNELLGVDTLESGTITDERVIGTGDYYIDLRNPGISAVSAIKEFSFGSSTQDSVTGWAVEKIESFRVYFSDVFFVKDYSYLVTYTAGYSPVPQDIKMVLSYMIGATIAEQKKLGGVIEYSLPQKTVKFAGPGVSEASIASTLNDLITTYSRKYKKYRAVVI